ncbi:hypothetical protein HDE_11614 [Halotydeus destructor]|nr:hypothetical protein HDE_11614 [Halotydeus destructor]
MKQFQFFVVIATITQLANITIGQHTRTPKPPKVYRGGEVDFRPCQKNYKNNFCLGARKNVTYEGGGHCFLDQDCDVFVIAYPLGDGRIQWFLRRNSLVKSQLVDGLRMRFFMTKNPFSASGPDQVPHNVPIVQAAEQSRAEPSDLLCVTVVNKYGRTPCTHDGPDHMYKGNRKVLGYLDNIKGFGYYGFETANFTSQEVIKYFDHNGKLVYEVKPYKEQLYATVILDVYETRSLNAQKWRTISMAQRGPDFLFGYSGNGPRPTAKPTVKTTSRQIITKPTVSTTTKRASNQPSGPTSGQPTATSQSTKTGPPGITDIDVGTDSVVTSVPTITTNNNSPDVKSTPSLFVPLAIVVALIITTIAIFSLVKRLQQPATSGGKSKKKSPHKSHRKA